MKATLIVIQGDADHAEAKKLVEKLMGSSDSQGRARMVAQARLIEAYERTRWPRVSPTLPELLAYLMDQHGLSRADLVPLLGTASRVSEVLSGKRELSMSMVRRLRDRFRISADLLVSHGKIVIARMAHFCRRFDECQQIRMRRRRIGDIERGRLRPAN